MCGEASRKPGHEHASTGVNIYPDCCRQQVEPTHHNTYNARARFEEETRAVNDHGSIARL